MSCSTPGSISMREVSGGRAASGCSTGRVPSCAAYAIERGAVVDVNAAARLGMMDRLRALISADPRLVHARGGDGQTPLHCACSVEVAAYLLDQGADIDARDVDHESTPAQYMMGDRHEVARFLVGRGCYTDILMTAGLGYLDLTKAHLDANPDCIRMLVNDEWFPKVNENSGGTIYNWTLGFNLSPHRVARKFGHDDVFELLMECSPEPVKLLEACWLGDEDTVKSIRARFPDIAADFTSSDRRQIALAARNNETNAVRLLLECSLPVTEVGQHGATPLHWAAFHGNTAMARLLIDKDAPLEAADATYSGTPMNWAMHGSRNGWRPDAGDYGETVEALIGAGAKLPTEIGGSEAVQAVLRRHGVAG